MKNKMRLLLSYKCLLWSFAISALILEAVSLALYLNKWSGYTWVIYTISSFGFIFIGVSIAMLLCIEFDKRLKDNPSLTEERKAGLIKKRQKAIFLLSVFFCGFFLSRVRKKAARRQLHKPDLEFFSVNDNPTIVFFADTVFIDVEVDSVFL